MASFSSILAAVGCYFWKPKMFLMLCSGQWASIISTTFPFKQRYRNAF